MRFAFILAAALSAAAQTAQFRPPAVPLIAHDPYFSVWSMADRLYDDDTRHWTGKPNTLIGLIQIDGTTYRVMGREPRNVNPLPQTSVEVLPTRTIYQFAGAGIRLQLTFLTPALPKDLDVQSRPLTYIVWDVSASDGREHDVRTYLDASSELAVNTPDQLTAWSRFRLNGQDVLRIGSRQQPVLEKVGDDLRIDWGYLYLSPDKSDGVSDAAVARPDAMEAFRSNGRLPQSDNLKDQPVARRGGTPVLAIATQFRVGSVPVSRYQMIAYDDLYSLEYFQRKVRPWWRRNGAGAAEMLTLGQVQYADLAARSKAFDDELMSALRRMGGEEYARLASLAYRQTLAAHKLVADADGTPLYFPKENFSNGCIGTVDVFYPSAPFFLLFNPALLEAQMRPLMDYSRMGRWKFPFAPHDLGTWPHANGQMYGGGELNEVNQMPVEESGNMLILALALSKAQGNTRFAETYWPIFTKWAEYLKDKGLDPENQLSTDDFAGHLAHNTNLSIKAIEALGAYAKLCDLTGRKSESAAYRKTAEEFARKVLELSADGNHYRLAFDKPGTWSQKYNLVWDRLLGLNLFPPDVARKEIAFYKTMQERFGLPLDNREKYTKLDWILWTATLTESRADFDAFVGPAYRFANESPTRVPLTDWYWTNDAKQRGFQARSVVGGLFIKMLSDPTTWKYWAER
ncbi:MAG: DUF4965 domain-containing protein [Acidobacteria bacterium]|nr:DUF4965 domain-containing protein [Acidobacteriota bacterium]